MNIICDNGKRIINTACAACIGYEKCGTQYDPHYRVFAYPGSSNGEDNEIKYVIGIFQLESQAQTTVAYIADSLRVGANVITV